MLKEVIIFPTDTVYGIGASLYDKKSIEKIYQIKGRDFNKQLAVLVANIDQIREFADVNDKAMLLARVFWPGGLTLILSSNEKYYNFSGERTIGVRIPNHKLALEILEKYGPLKTTSVNKSGEAPLNDFGIIYDIYHDKVNLIYDNNEKIEGISSTIIDLTNDLKIIREGNIKELDILEVLKSLE